MWNKINEGLNDDNGKQMALSKNLGLVIGSTILVYALCEGVITALYHQGLIEPVVLWITEEKDPEGQLQIDPQIGVRLSPVPSRVMTYHSRHGVVQLSNIKGNNYGFSAPKDFFPTKESEEKFRVAIFGDSMTAHFYIESAWPLLLERQLHDKGFKEVEIYNFSIDATGIANWSRVLSTILEKENFEIDAIVIAACFDNLTRSFVWLQSPKLIGAGGGQSVLGMAKDGFDSSAFKLPDFEEMLEFNLFRSYSPEEFEQIVTGEMKPRIQRPYDLYVFNKILEMIDDLRNDDLGGELIGDPDRNQTLGSFRIFSQKRKIPLYLISHEPESELVRSDAEKLQVDELLGFGLPLHAEKRYRIPSDMHWNEIGHQYVAEHLSPVFIRWYKKWKALHQR